MLTDCLIFGINTIYDETNKSYDRMNLRLDKEKYEYQMDLIESGSSSSVNNIKREQLSPQDNGNEFIEKTRKSSQNFDVDHNLTSIFLNSAQEKKKEMSTRNYSEFMRNLAAKYNNDINNTNNISLMNANKNDIAKDRAVKTDGLKISNEVQAMTPNVVPLVSSLLSSLQFSANVLPPLIDMSSTQALVTLARASKEVEIQNILKTAQKRPQQFLNLSTKSIPVQKQRKALNSMQSRSAFITESYNPTPLDLSSVPIKRSKSEYSTRSLDSVSRNNTMDDKSTNNIASYDNNECKSNISYHCQSQSDEISSWTVEDVCNFVGSINICAEYVQNFRDQCIDGSGLPLLTEDHLTNSLGMKLGPALKLRSLLAKKLGGPCPCVSCFNQNAFTISTISPSFLNNNINLKKKVQSRPASTDSIS